MTEIPGDIMEAARDVAFDCDPTKTSEQIAGYIARAILSAEQRGEQRGREAAAQLVEGGGDWASAYIRATGHVPMSAFIAAAIRKGE